MTDAAPPAPSAVAAARWLTKAREDLAVAELIRESSSTIGWAACFHAQQAAEKALKSALVLRGVDFPRSHALERLVALLPADIRARFDEESLAALTPWAIAGRYPEDIAPPDEDTINSIVTLSREIVATAESISG